MRHRRAGVAARVTAAAGPVDAPNATAAGSHHAPHDPLNCD